ncbi:MAG: cryptochrome/photolyase family protein [Alphaproteobacteria bacterium]|jgi:deoxyribodipyrimidine photolyase-related protein|nr:cryptochrome/photolyase family protein [Alphaproteobacteria bacterium]
MAPETPTRNLVIVTGDQLSPDSAAFDGFDAGRDAVLMMEVAEEAAYVPQHKARLVLFFSAMRHFRQALADTGITLHYTALDDPENRGCFAGEIDRRVRTLRPEKLVMAKPGDYRVETAIADAAQAAGLELAIVADRHFLADLDAFARKARTRKSLLLETFYRDMRRRHDVLMDGDAPVGGQWNFDPDNRETFGKGGPGDIPPPRAFAPDAVTCAVMEMVGRRFPDSPGRLDHFAYPVTAAQAREALDDFIANRLADFGRFQDAMHTGQPFLYHSRLSCVLNLHLLDPRDAIGAAVAAWEEGAAPLNSVEGFVRQILGWREYIRGIYWALMPDYADRNALGADLPMPAFMWSAETDMTCVRQSVGQLIDHAYAHHIQRLMVLGLFALLLGVRPYDVHRWHLSMYADAIDWVSLPNVLGMSQYADGGVVGTKPYAASGNYISRMSNYCDSCRYNPKKATGEDACPFTTLYWDFLARHRETLGGNRRMQLQLRNLDRKDAGEMSAIRARADTLKAACTAETYL